jgi:hypothetical protein
MQFVSVGGGIDAVLVIAVVARKRAVEAVNPRSTDSASVVGW